MLVTDDLIRRVERGVVDDAASFAQTLKWLDPTDPVRYGNVGGGAVLLLGQGSYINRAVGLGLVGEPTAADIERVEELSAEAGVAPSFEICPLAAPRLFELLGERCYRLSSFRTVLVRELEHLSDLNQLAPPDDLGISLVDETTLADWQASAVHGFEIPAGAPIGVSDRFSAGRFHTPGERFFIGRIGDSVVANAALSLRDGTATLGGMATAPAFRRRGVQAALIAHRLRYAAAQGCDLAVVAADPGSNSERNLQRFGFRIAYTETFMTREPMKSEPR